MTNEELIKALRKCGKQSPDRCWDCEYYDREPWCESALANDAADALETAEQRIVELNTKCADLQSQINSMESEIEELLPKEGEWLSVDDGASYFKCSVCGEINCCRGKYCPDCGSRMRKGERE
jgi:hypothetical protein